MSPAFFSFMKRHPEVITMRVFNWTTALLAMIALHLPLVNSVAAQEQNSLPQGVTRVASIEGITEYRLENGLQVLLFPDLSRPNTTVNVVYKVGSRHEGIGETGMAHLLEHLLFRGTERYPSIVPELLKRGAGSGATTSYERTNYSATFPASEETLDWVLDMEADRMVNARITEEDLRSEFTVVRNELERNDNLPIRPTLQKLMATAYEWHPYGKATIGTRSDIENVRVENLRRFYQEHYQPDNAVLMLAGNFDEAAALRKIAATFGLHPRPKRVLEPSWTIEPPQEGARQVVINRVGDTQVLLAGYHVPPVAHPDAAALEILRVLMADPSSGRLHRSLIETKKASSLFTYSFRMRDPGYMVFTLQMPKSSPMRPAEEALLETLESSAAKSVAPEELERARSSAINELERGFNDPNRLVLDLTEWVSAGDWRLFFAFRENLKKATAADVGRVAAAYLDPRNRTLAKYIPTDDPKKVEIPQVSDEALAAVTRTVKGGSEVSEGEAFDTSLANVAARTRYETIGGVRAGFLRKENRGDSVDAYLFLHFGDRKALEGRSMAGYIAARMLQRGTRTKTAQQVQDELTKLKGRVTFRGDGEFVSMYISGTHDTFADILGLAGEMLREPSFPEREFELLKQQYLSGLMAQRGQPTAEAQRQISKLMKPYEQADPRYKTSLEEEIAELSALTVEDVRRFYADFYGASKGEIAVVGDFDEEAVRTKAASIFEGWASPAKYERLTEVLSNAPASKKAIETPGKANGYFIARADLALGEQDADYPAMVLANYMLGGGFLNSRLSVRIRQKDGLSYTVGSALESDPFEPVSSLTVSAIAAPQNLDRVEAAFREEIQRILAEGFAESEVEAARSAWLLRSRRLRGRDMDLVVRLRELLYAGRTFAWEAELEEKIRSLKAADIDRAFRRYVDPAEFTMVRAGDLSLK